MDKVPSLNMSKQTYYLTITPALCSLLDKPPQAVEYSNTSTVVYKALKAKLKTFHSHF